MKSTIFFGKTAVILLLLCFSATTLTAQVGGRKGSSAKGTVKGKITPYGSIETNWYKVGWFADLNGGIRLLGATSDAAKLGAGFSGNAGIGFLVSDRVGVKGRIDYNRFSFTPGIGAEPEATGGAMSFSLEAITDLIPLSTQQAKVRDWRVSLHGGFGYTSYNNRSFKENRLESNPDYFNDPIIKGNDDMGHMIIGITPQYHFNGRWSLNLDFSTFFLFKQDFTLDNYNGQRFDGIGNISNLTFGVTFRP
jgi:hypothetical protein